MRKIACFISMLQRTNLCYKTPPFGGVENGLIIACNAYTHTYDRVQFIKYNMLSVITVSIMRLRAGNRPSFVK